MTHSPEIRIGNRHTSPQRSACELDLNLWSFRTDSETHRWRLSIDKVSGQPTGFAPVAWLDTQGTR